MVQESATGEHLASIHAGMPPADPPPGGGRFAPAAVGSGSVSPQAVNCGG